MMTYCKERETYTVNYVVFNYMLTWQNNLQIIIKPKLYYRRLIPKAVTQELKYQFIFKLQVSAHKLEISNSLEIKKIKYIFSK